MSINAAGLKAEVITGSVRILMQHVFTNNLLDKPESEIRFAEWKWLDTHLSVIEMLVAHLRRRISPKLDIDGEIEDLAREPQQHETPAPQAKAASRTNRTKPASATRRVIKKRPGTTTKSFRKGDVEISVNLEVNRYTMKPE